MARRCAESPKCAYRFAIRVVVAGLHPQETGDRQTLSGGFAQVYGTGTRRLSSSNQFWTTVRLGGSDCKVSGTAASLTIRKRSPSDDTSKEPKQN